MKILVLNSGSSSIKYQLFDMESKQVLSSGLVEKIGEDSSRIKHHLSVDSKAEDIEVHEPIPDHQKGLERVVDLLLDKEYGPIESEKEVVAVGHRVVHGGETFSQPTIVDSEVLGHLNKLSHLAPLHNPANITGIEVASKIFSSARQIAVFDTAFHQSMPDYAYRFSIPNEYYEKEGLRAYGFHGTSHSYVSRAAANYLGLPLDNFNVVTIHLGNGCSMAAIKNGKCVDTTMGLTPLGGLIMGTRSGDIDPSLILYLASNKGMNIEAIDKLLNKQSGLKGLTGDNDLRNILDRYEKGDQKAVLAVEMYVYRIKKYLGAYAAALGRLDAVVFTAGVGENSAFIREKVCAKLSVVGIGLSDELNHSSERGIRSIQSDESSVKVLVVPTNEELEIANQSFELIK